jgi:hypothetical protein
MFPALLSKKSCFSDRFLYFCPGLSQDWDSHTYAFHVAEITGVCHQVYLLRQVGSGVRSFHQLFASLAWSCDPPSLCLLSSCDYRHVPPHLAWFRWVWGWITRHSWRNVLSKGMMEEFCRHSNCHTPLSCLYPELDSCMGWKCVQLTPLSTPQGWWGHTILIMRCGSLQGYLQIFYFPMQSIMPACFLFPTWCGIKRMFTTYAEDGQKEHGTLAIPC